MYLSGFRIGTAMQFQGGVICDNAAVTQARGCKKPIDEYVVASACLGTEANTPRAIRLMLPTRRCWPNIAETVLSCRDRPTAAAYSARLNGMSAKKGSRYGSRHNEYFVEFEVINILYINYSVNGKVDGTKNRRH